MSVLKKVRSQLHGLVAPTKELQSFLILARYECIESVMIDDLNIKIQLLQKRPEFEKLLKKFKVNRNGIPVGLNWAIRLLEKENKVFVYHNQELTLTMPDYKRTAITNTQSKDVQLAYLHMAQAYRDISTDETKNVLQKRNS